MNTVKQTRALATFGVYGNPSDDEIAVLDLADQFREELCAIYQREHEGWIELRDRLFPSLWEAMTEFELAKARIYSIEREIKAHHSEVRDRNAVTVEQRRRLEAARKSRTEAAKNLAEQRKPWREALKAFRAHLKGVADWKNVQDLAKRRAAYESIVWPEELRELGEFHLSIDLERRDLFRRYQSLGLHSSVRKEIVDASKSKLSKHGPGMRYLYGRKPEPKPWRKITIQFSGGLIAADAFDGNSSRLKLEEKYVNEKRRGEETVYWVSQQIGTAGHPRMITYSMKLDRPLPRDAVIQRWTLVVGEKRSVVPIVSGMDFSKPRSDGGLLCCSLGWSQTEGGVQVARLWGEHTNERVVLPWWIIDRRLDLDEVQQECDEAANAALEERAISRSKRPGSLQGVAALESFCAKNPGDMEAANVLHHLSRRLEAARRKSQRAARCIEKIYETVASRACALHAFLWIKPIDLKRLKRYDSRDLLRADSLRKDSRRILSAVAPGKLKALLERYGLAASDEATPEPPADARETDVFTSYVLSLGRKTGTRQPENAGRSQSVALPVGAK